MSLASQIQALATRVATEFKTVRTEKANVSHTHGVTDLTATGTKSATTFLRGDNTWATPAGGGASGPYTSLVTTADQSVSSATAGAFTDVNGQSFQMTASAAYEFDGLLLYTVVATTTGFRLGFNVTFSAPSLTAWIEYPSAATVTTTFMQTGTTPSMAATASSLYAAPQYNLVRYRGIVVNGATAQPLTLQVASELANTALTVKKGSIISYRLM